jgi:signal transduction histidine kinase
MDTNWRILIVDDESEALKGYEEFLKPPSVQSSVRSSRGSAAPKLDVVSAADPFELFMASSGDEAVTIFKREFEAGRPIAAGFFDVKMAGRLDGLQTILEIKAIDPRVYCAVVTAYHDRTVDEIHKLFGEEFKDHWDYLNKPFTRGEIVQKARQMVAAWNRSQQLATTQAQLIRAEKMAAIAQVARGVGHEFGNILLRVMGKLDLALMQTQDEKIKAHMQEALKATDRASIIVRNLQSFSKVEPKMEIGTLSQPIDEALSLMNHELIKASVQVERNVQSKSAFRMDSRALGQVFLNLFINAKHAMPKGGKLSVTVEDLSLKGRNGISCRVKDTGIGISKDILPRIFEYAFTTKGDTGSGLGLSISKDIVEQHGGVITVSSEQGKGTEFSLWFPLDGKATR